MPQLKRLKLPTRYYHFNEHENYIKLLSIGEGIFPKDRINLKLDLQESDCVVTTESATKIYPSTDEFGINRFEFTLNNRANLECINDELILYKDAKYLQLFTLNADESSNFFYTDILSSGRSFEHFDFSEMRCRNRFYIEDNLEYYENFTLSGAFMKEYFIRHNSENDVLAKIYIKTHNNTQLQEVLRALGFDAFTLSQSKKMLIGVLSEANVGLLKKRVHTLWSAYRHLLNKKPFQLGKQ